MRGRQVAALAVAVLIGLLSTAAVSSVLYAQASDEVARRFEDAAAAQADQLVEEVRRGVAVADSARGLVLASDTLTAEEFGVFVEQLLLDERFPAADRVELLAVTPVGQEQELEAALDARGHEGTTIRPDEPVGDVRYVIVLSEPSSRGRSTIGFDVHTDPEAREAASAALRRGEPRMTAPTTPLPEAGTGARVIVYLPVVRSSPDAEEVIGTGFASIVVRGGDLVADALDGRSALALRVVDLGVEDPGGRGTVGVARPEGTDDVPVRRQEVVLRDVFGRTWEITVSAVAGYAVPAAASVATAILGLLLTGVVAVLVHTAQRQEHRAQAMAAEATAELRDSQAALAASNAALEWANANLQRSNDELSRFTHVASHDLKEPLRMVSGFAGLLETQLSDRLGEEGLTEAEQTSLSYIRRGAERMQELVSDLLELATVDRSGGLRETVDVRDAVDRTLEDLAGEIQRADATIRVGPLAPVVIDPRQIGGLIQNLISNAIKFRRPDVPSVVDVRAVREGPTWRLEVADNGIGITEEDREVVFEAFRRMHSREEYEGTGIGLAICASVVTAHGGTIRIRDGIDGGACLVVELPQPDPVHDDHRSADGLSVT